ncbi:putative HET-domain-containing protein [Seiridium unicorne]|uniref:HET-domain-containing protein n=1 Tax=Seiridium unicorne TaxID=138068 RepID=A0ABR2UGS0_9PEZI
MSSRQTLLCCSAHFVDDGGFDALWQFVHDRDFLYQDLWWKVLSFSTWMKAVDDYTRRDLTRDTDVLLALTGVSQVPGYRFVSKGFPFADKFSLGHPEYYLANSLAWSCADSARRRNDCCDISSWSWAAWEGPVTPQHDISDYKDLAIL